jgi:hypothetical protein
MDSARGDSRDSTSRKSSCGAALIYSKSVVADKGKGIYVLVLYSLLYISLTCIMHLITQYGSTQQLENLDT